MKKILLALVVGVLFFACSEEDEVAHREAKLFSMTFAFGEAIIDEENGRLYIDVPQDVNLVTLMPEIEISKGATIYPPAGVALDFSNPVNFTITSEDGSTKKVYTAQAYKPIAEFSVYNASAFSSENLTVEKAKGATIEVYLRREDVDTGGVYRTLTCNEEGKVSFHGDPEVEYCIVASHEKASNIKDGYLVKGVIDSEEALNQYKYIDPEAKIGELMIGDVNGDARITEEDKTNCYWLYTWPKGIINKYAFYIVE
ncbi:DUF5018 domain-containing protein [Rapidithrix thailandica]|uniref:DUF5018 domain-containing protein n=1 Tax=Rapidithrix thailandica TaxID=413964 RepID=A0AAW9S334_9BACT